jgi:hypothetical protein
MLPPENSCPAGFWHSRWPVARMSGSNPTLIYCGVTRQIDLVPGMLYSAR